MILCTTRSDGGEDGEQNPSNDENKNPSDEENSGEVPSSSHGDQSSTDEGASGELPPNVGSNSLEETSSIDATPPPPSDTAKTEISDSGDRIDLTSKTETAIPKTGIAHWKYGLIAGMVLSATMSVLLAMLYFKKWKNDGKGGLK